MTNAQVIPHYQTSYQAVEEFLSRYHRGELPLIRYFLVLAKVLEENKIPYLWIGSGPIQPLTKTVFRSKISKSTDIDIVTSIHPSELIPLIGDSETKLAEERLIEQSYYDHFKGYTVKEGDGIVYHFVRNGSGRSEYLPFCIFYNNVNVIPVYNSDFENRRTIQVADLKIPLPTMGLLLATRLHPQALQKTRTYKSMLITESMKDEAEAKLAGQEAKERFRDAIKVNRTRVGKDDFERARRGLENIGKRRRFNKFLAFVEEAFSL